MVEVFNYRAFDGFQGSWTESMRVATRQYIRLVGGVAIEESKREIDDDLVDSDGHGVIDPMGKEAALLVRLLQSGGRAVATIEGEVGHHPFTPLVEAGLVSQAASGNEMSFEITERGQRAIKEFL